MTGYKYNIKNHNLNGIIDETLSGNDDPWLKRYDEYVYDRKVWKALSPEYLEHVKETRENRLRT